MMRQCKFHHLIAIAAAVLATACSDNDTPFYNGTGQLAVNVTVDAPAGLPDEYLPQPGDFAITLTSVASGAAHSWPSLTEFTQEARYIAGPYQVSARHGEPLGPRGWETPVFSGETEVSLTEGTLTTAEITAKMESAMLRLSPSESFSSRFSDTKIELYSRETAPLETDATAIGLLFPTPGPIDLYMTVDNGNDKRLNLRIARDIAARKASLSDIALDYSENTICVSVNRTEAGKIALTDELFATRAPIVTTSLQKASLREQQRPDAPFTFTVDPAAQLDEVTLTIASTSLRSDGAPAEIDLMKPDADGRAWLAENGVALPTEFSSSFTIDLTPLLDHLDYNPGGINTSVFAVKATDIAGRASIGAESAITTLPVDLTVKEISPVVLGLNRIRVVVTSPDGSPTPLIRLAAGETLLQIDKTEDLGNGDYALTASVAEGDGPVDLKIYYNGRLMHTVSVERVSPVYEVEADPFASAVALRITPDDPSLRDIILDNLNVWVNGNRVPVYIRDRELNTLTIIGLQPQKSYTVATGMASDKPSQSIGIVTEADRQLPNNDFEDVKNNIKWENLPSGGRYSQNYVEIYNCQNHTSLDYWTPATWASVNAKTFDRGAANANTWYVQPSCISVTDAYSGDYAVELRAVAFDPKGPEIPPYLQESEPFTRYSRNIPEIGYRAAGRLFLGTYSYNRATMTETYTEGIPFTSRPMSLNGVYRYVPSRADLQDSGTATITVFGTVDGQERVIAAATAKLRVAYTYTAFHLPLTYTLFGIKATRVKVMFSTSDCAADIKAETAAVKTYPDPSTATSIGSRLWLDNITLAY